MNVNLYRCGWCGDITDEDGNVLPFGKKREKVIKILEKYGDKRVIKTTCEWCYEERMADLSGYYESFEPDW